MDKEFDYKDLVVGCTLKSSTHRWDGNLSQNVPTAAPETLNLFNRNVEAFLEASKYIHQRCTNFAGRDICAPLSAWVFNVLARVFSKCDPNVTAYKFNCVLQEHSRLIPCVAKIRTDGRVQFQLKEVEQ